MLSLVACLKRWALTRTWLVAETFLAAEFGETYNARTHMQACCRSSSPIFPPSLNAIPSAFFVIGIARGLRRRERPLLGDNKEVV